MFKIVHDLCPLCIRDNVVLTKESHTVDTKASISHHVTMPRVRLEGSRRNFTYRGPCLLNILDNDLKGKSSLASFKRNLYALDMFAPS